MKYKNVIKDNGEEYELYDNVESDSYSGMFHYLKLLMNDFDDYLFIMYGTNSGNKLPISRTFKHDKKILFWLQGENKRQDFKSIKDDYLAIFAEYHSTDINTKCYNIPLYHSIKNVKIVPFDERLYKMSFVGNLNNNRIQMVSNLTGVSETIISMGLLFAKNLTLTVLGKIANAKNPGCFFKFNPDFNKGISHDDYLYVLSQSKISLCPRGWSNAETFRLYESLKLGCVVITDKLPDREYFSGDIPIIEISKWENIESMICPICSNNSVVAYYDDKLSSKSIAKYIINCIGSHVVSDDYDGDYIIR